MDGIQESRIVDGFQQAAMEYRGQRFEMRELTVADSERVRAAPDEDAGLVALALAMTRAEGTEATDEALRLVVDAIRRLPASCAERLNALFLHVQGRDVEDDAGN